MQIPIKNEEKKKLLTNFNKKVLESIKFNLC